MGHFLQVYTLFFYVLSLVNSNYLTEGLRNIQPVNNIEDYSININSKVISHFAHNVITSRAVNRANISKDAFFNVALPKSAFITKFSMIINGVMYAGKINKKGVEIASGHIDIPVRIDNINGEMFTFTVNLLSQSEVTFELVYEEMLKPQFDKYKMSIRVWQETLPKNFQIKVDIYEPQGISFLDAQASFLKNDMQTAMNKSFSGEKGHVSFKYTRDQEHVRAENLTTLLNDDFIVTYDINRESARNIQIAKGYFVQFFAPIKLTGIPKIIIYVIDTGVSNLYLEQIKESLLTLLTDTTKYDYINFIWFHRYTEVWKDSFVKATPKNIEKAKKFVRAITVHGYISIHDPLLKAVELLNKAHLSKEVPERSVSLINLLTDNIYEEKPTIILQNVKKVIQGKYILNCLHYHVGKDYTFYEKLAFENSGVTQRNHLWPYAQLQMGNFLREKATLTLLDIEMHYPENATAALTQSNFKHYFEGDEIVVAGRLTENDLNSFIVDVNAEGANKSLKYTESATLQEQDSVQKQQEHNYGDFIERLWAYLTIQQLLEKSSRPYTDQSERENLTEQALKLSLKYNFVNALTSLIVTMPATTLIVEKLSEDDIYQDIPVLYDDDIYQDIPVLYGADADPHFVINVPHKKDALCFNIQEKPGVVLNLIKDQELGIAVNAELIGNKKTDNNVISNETYFGRLGIVNREKRLKIEVTTQMITILNGDDTEMFTWGEITSVSKEGFNLVINKKKNVTVSFGKGAKFIIILHEVWKKHPLHRDFLGFYTLDDHNFSAGVHGLLGQFFHGIDYKIFDVHKSDNIEKPDAKMLVKNKLLTVTRGTQKDYRKDPRNGSKVPCWFVHSNGEGLIDGSKKDYIVPDIFSIA
ncbi:inter-alpha-trypsin inhibitor heavy chain H3-like isoform X2 [Mixophyes fleayi]|uniref:inter-alpha-trypsin inhibitor heavy chain H3-like isoform X2 n=1 Tax=Mixophyes fleayi TaxID=3061075 RepID=UPI003F4D81EE